MFFKNKSKLDELNNKINDNKLTSVGISRDQASKIEGQNPSFNKTDNDSKKSNSGDTKRQVEVHGEFDSLHIENLSQRMKVLKQDIDECQK